MIAAKCMISAGKLAAPGSGQRQGSGGGATRTAESSARDAGFDGEEPREEAVDEGRRLVRRQRVRELDRLVDRDGVRYVVVVEQLPRRQPEQRAIDARHAVERPALRVGRQQLVDPLP